MTDFSTSQGPDLATSIVAGLTRHGLTAVAGFLGAKGVLSSDQQTQFVSVGVAVALWGATVLWSVIQKRNAAKAK